MTREGVWGGVRRDITQALLLGGAEVPSWKNLGISGFQDEAAEGIRQEPGHSDNQGQPSFKEI